MVGGRIFKRIGREYKGRNHDSDRIELKISWLRSDLCDQIFRLIFFGRVPFDQSWLNASQPWPWVEKFQILGGPTYFYMGDSHFVWETAILYGHHPQLRHAVWSKQACTGFQGFEPAQKINPRIFFPIGLFRHDDGRARAAKIAYIDNLAVNNNMVRFIKVKVSYNEFPFWKWPHFRV